MAREYKPCVVLHVDPDVTWSFVVRSVLAESGFPKNVVSPRDFLHDEALDAEVDRINLKIGDGKNPAFLYVACYDLAMKLLGDHIIPAAMIVEPFGSREVQVEFMKFLRGERFLDDYATIGLSASPAVHNDVVNSYFEPETRHYFDKLDFGRREDEVEDELVTAVFASKATSDVFYGKP